MSLLAGLSFVVPVQAEVSFDFSKPWYAGLQTSRNKISLEEGSSVEGAVIQKLSADTSDNTTGFIIGMQYWPHADLELRYEGLGNFHHKLEYTDSSKPVEVDVSSKLDYSALSFSVKPKYHLVWGIEVSAELGAAVVKGERNPTVKVSGTQSDSELSELMNLLEDEIDGESETEIAMVYGAAVQYRFKNSSPWLWRYTLRRTSHGDEDLGSTSFSLVRLFKE